MLVASTTLSKRKTIATILKIEDLGIVFWGDLLFFFSGIPPCCSAYLFLFCFAVFCNSCTPPADRFLFLQIGCFRHSQVSCYSCTLGAPPIAELRKIAKRIIFNVQNEMAVCHCRVAKVCEANDIQWADQHGVPPQMNDKRFSYCFTNTTRTSLPVLFLMFMEKLSPPSIT